LKRCGKEIRQTIFAGSSKKVGKGTAKALDESTSLSGWPFIYLPAALV
jgi:hypothetical protein